MVMYICKLKKECMVYHRPEYSNKLLRKRLAPHGYYELPHTPRLWRDVTRPVQITLVIDDFGVKYVGKEHAEHLVNALKQEYEISED